MYRQLFFHSVCCVFTPGWFPLLWRNLLSTWDPLSVVDLTSHIRGVLLSPHLCLQVEVLNLFDPLNSLRVNKIIKLEKKKTRKPTRLERQMLQFFLCGCHLCVIFMSTLEYMWRPSHYQQTEQRNNAGNMEAEWEYWGWKGPNMEGWGRLSQNVLWKSYLETYDLVYQVQKVEGIEHW